ALRELNAATGRRVGLVVEAKSPAWHAERGLDLAAAIRAELAAAGDLPVVIETFDPAALRAWRHHAHGWPEAAGWGWWQLLGENAWSEADCDYDQLRSADGLRGIAGWADGVAVNLERAAPDLMAAAHAAGLTVCAYTARAEAPDGGLPRALAEGGLDGVFTDHPEVVAAWLRGRENASGLRRMKL
ncbi:MAG: glycerophosphodiester phosphodiesterase family protein, partial [Verrucomicrobiota bacterium]